ncbi:MAG: zf-HC2 domain-containing protein [Tabrizicola sp.]|jgi:hypothetical protein|nr:zf-HC2 domain-containing protein [Tabrizicola sp.]
MAITDELLMAYADGELDAAEMAEVERAMAEDESLAERVAIFADTRRAVKDAYPAPAPVSADLAARVRAMTEAAEARPATAAVIDLAARRKPAPVWSLAMAASLALAVGLAGGWYVGTGASGGEGLRLTALSDPAISGALATVAAGERLELADGNAFAAIATFRTADGEVCREFEYDQAAGSTYVAVACDQSGTWDLRFAVASAPDDGGYAPASSLDTLDAYLEATGAGQPMTREDEAAVLAALRQP